MGGIVLEIRVKRPTENSWPHIKNAIQAKYGGRDVFSSLIAREPEPFE